MSKSPPLPPWLKHLALLLALSTLYVITARLGLTLALPPGDKATAVWPPSGIALAALLLLGYRLWPGIWLGAFLANFWDFFTPDNDFSLTTHLLASGGIAVGSTLQPLLGAYLLRRCLGQQSPLEGAGSVFWFLGVGLLMYLVAATVGVTTLYLAGFTSLAVYPLNCWTWWLGDVLGVLMVTPLALAWWRKGPERAWGSRRIAEAGVLLGVLLMVEWWVFGGWELWGIDSRFLVYLTVPPLVWAAFRFGARGATLGLLLVTGIAVWGTAQGHGPFAGETLNESLLLQTFMGVLTVMTLILVGVLTERQRTERESQRAREGLTDFIENAAVGLHWVGPDGAILWANQTELDLLGYRQEEYIGQHISEFHADQEVIDDILSRLANHETIHDYEARLRCKDGSIKHVLIDSNVFWQEGQFVHTRCFTWDITRRKEAEESARRLAEEMALVDQVARIITSTLDTSEVYERFAAGLKELIPFDRVMINTIDSTGEAFKYQQIAGLVYPGRRTGDTIPLEGSLTKQFMITVSPWSGLM
jgi:PAS domain S-box-containing protein